MKIDKMFGLKIGDKLVMVRNHYQNYDRTKVPYKELQEKFGNKG